jgi:trimethylamine--corrinoid protein Co-methyltransferase
VEAAEHTIRNFKSETWLPKLMERNYHGNWVKAGKPTTQGHARKKLAEIIETHMPVPLGDHKRSELERLRRESEEVLKLQ